jgi:hypothetical protein
MPLLQGEEIVLNRKINAAYDALVALMVAAGIDDSKAEIAVMDFLIAVDNLKVLQIAELKKQLGSGAGASVPR